MLSKLWAKIETNKNNKNNNNILIKIIWSFNKNNNNIYMQVRIHDLQKSSFLSHFF